jgi:2-hydroxycyclohexanecarboxyl-CoA dehydrogenase
MQMNIFRDEVVLLNGATAGIGLECAAQLAEAGVKKLMMVGRNRERGETAAASVRARAPESDIRFVAADISMPQEAERVTASAIDAFGRIDVLVNSASGGLNPRLFHQFRSEDIPSVFAMYLSTVINCCQAAYPGMRQQESGVIINFASDAAKVPTPGETIHGAALAGVLMFSRSLALEAARSGIRVNCVTPSITRDTMSYDRAREDEFSRKLFKKAEARAFLGLPDPRDYASLVVFLASPSASKMTGQAISINGGISAA